MSVAEINEVRPYLTFTLEEELFAVDVGKVREVLDLTKITRVPQTPKYMKGVINLRGNVVPVIDFRLKFGMEEVEATIDTCIIVLEIDVEGEFLVIGALADSVREVFELEPDQIDPAPKLGTKFNVDYLYGIGKKDEDFLMILNIDKAFSIDEINFVQELTENNEVAEK
ncbi:MAG: chemotaxis protein CheW [Melioribacteraceae bacterium]|nr:chemotaxis protein CheW [Melioribacteraceae bacterium]